MFSLNGEASEILELHKTWALRGKVVTQLHLYEVKPFLFRNNYTIIVYSFIHYSGSWRSSCNTLPIVSHKVFLSAVKSLFSTFIFSEPVDRTRS